MIGAGYAGANSAGRAFSTMPEHQCGDIKMEALRAGATCCDGAAGGPPIRARTGRRTPPPCQPGLNDGASPDGTLPRGQDPLSGLGRPLLAVAKTVLPIGKLQPYAGFDEAERGGPLKSRQFSLFQPGRPSGSHCFPHVSRAPAVSRPPCGDPGGSRCLPRHDRIL